MVPPPSDEPALTTPRRRLLGATGAAAATTLTGCSVLPARTLDDPEREVESRSAVLDYHDDGERIAEVAVIDKWGNADRWRYPLRTLIWHAEDTTLERLEYTFRPVGTGRAPEFYLQRPGGHPWEPIRFSRTEGGNGAVLSIPDLGIQGRGSVTLEFIVRVHDEEPLDLRVDVDAALSSDGLLGRDYRIEGSIERTLPGERLE